MATSRSIAQSGDPLRSALSGEMPLVHRRASADGSRTVSLRLQLLAVGLLTLVLPWTGFRYVQEMETALRAGLEQSLLASAATVAAALEEQSAALVLAAGLRPAARRCARSMRRRSRASPSSTACATTIGTTTDDAALAIGGGHRALGRHLRPVRLSVRRVADRDLVYQRQPGADAVRRSRRALRRGRALARWWLLNDRRARRFSRAGDRARTASSRARSTTDASSARGKRRRAGMRSKCACR